MWRLRMNLAGESLVIMASNRLPVTATRGADGVRLRTSDGGLISGLREVAQRWPVLWFGWDGLARRSDDPENGPALRAGVVGISLAESEVEHFYRRYSNSTLWPILHGLLGDASVAPEDWTTYERVNRRFAESMLPHLRPGDRVWVHDYHLFLLPRFLREALPGLRISFFLHTPFPTAREFARLAQHRALLQGILASDVIGFHTEPYAQNFVNAAQELGYRGVKSTLHVDGRAVQIKSQPMGIDAIGLSSLSNTSEVKADADRIRQSNRALLLGVDRLDYTKGIPQRLLAYEQLLTDHPELHERVSFMQVAVPTRQEIGAYRDLREVVDELVHRINGRFGTPAWLPIEFLHDRVDLRTLVTLYRAADVMVVTSQRDGLNLVAKEFVAARPDGDGVLVLSQFAGAAEELRAALLVNPSHIEGLADTYYRALTMPEFERRNRMRQLRSAVESNTIFRWAAEFLDQPEDAVQVLEA